MSKNKPKSRQNLPTLTLAAHRDNYHLAPAATNSHCPDRGTGLGLSIINGIVEKHRGKFELDSKCQNTRFIVTIPKRHLATDEEQIDSKKMPS